MKLLERYLAAIDKCYIQSLTDPETEPYKSKYGARKLFEELYDENINEESDIIREEFETLGLIKDNGKLKFIVINSDQQANESSGK